MCGMRQHESTEIWHQHSGGYNAHVHTPGTSTHQTPHKKIIQFPQQAVLTTY